MCEYFYIFQSCAAGDDDGRVRFMPMGILAKYFLYINRHILHIITFVCLTENKCRSLAALTEWEFIFTWDSPQLILKIKRSLCIVTKKKIGVFLIIPYNENKSINWFAASHKHLSVWCENVFSRERVKTSRAAFLKRPTNPHPYTCR